MIKAIKGLYRYITSQVLVNGHVSEPFSVRSGVRQGCPLSPLAFVSVVEPLLQKILLDKVWKGFTIPGSGGQKIKVLAYMDDIVAVGTSQRDLDRVSLLFGLFCGISGMSINWQKSKRCQLGQEIQLKSDKFQEVEEVKVLGITFDKKLSGGTSFKNLFQKMNKKLGFWKLRDLSLRGKVLIIKAVVLPLLLYTCVVLPPGKRWVQRSFLVFCGDPAWRDWQGSLL